MPRILIVEDDEKLGNELKIFLEKNGYAITQVKEFAHVLENIISTNWDLVLLDINLPHLDGQYICKEVRKTSNVPIMMITSRNTEIDELLSINYGADDYITKPFNVQILLARIASILKRTNQNQTSEVKIDYGEFVLHIENNIVEANGKTVELTLNERKILYFLAQRKNTIVTREELMNYLWDSQMFVDDNTLTVNVTRLRNKLEEIGMKDKIETKRGQGYLLK